MIKGEYIVKFGITLVNCANCDCFMTNATDLMQGDFNTEFEALERAEEMHDDNFKKCRKPKLIIQIDKYYRHK